MSIARQVIFWVAALVFTLTLARYQERTGPTYPIRGDAAIGGTKFHYEIERTHGGSDDHPVVIEINDPTVAGTVIWKRYKYNEPMHDIPMERDGSKLIARLPGQPPAGKLEYKVVLRTGNEQIMLPAKEAAVIRFKGVVPLWILVPHILCMFTALFFASRTALGAIYGERNKKLAWIAFICLIVGGFGLGPLVQKFAFDAYWTGWPFGGDLTDNKTAAMVLAWGVALFRMRGDYNVIKARWWILAAMLVMFAVYLIPHSMRGSELDYNALPHDSLGTISTAPASDSAVPPVMK